MDILAYTNLYLHVLSHQLSNVDAVQVQICRNCAFKQILFFLHNASSRPLHLCTLYLTEIQYLLLLSMCALSLKQNDFHGYMINFDSYTHCLVIIVILTRSAAMVCY